LVAAGPFGSLIRRAALGRAGVVEWASLEVTGLWFGLAVYDWVTSHRRLDWLYSDEGPQQEPEGRGSTGPARGPSLPLELARRGWKPHKFRGSEVVVFLPEAMVAEFDPEGVLLASTTGKEVEFSATLHADFDEDRAGALDFVSYLAREKGRKVRDVGTYRYFFDPGEEKITARAMRFWVIGIPGAVVVVSILCEGKAPVSEPLREVRKELPQIIGELL
jgi:hypothetical protein